VAEAFATLELGEHAAITPEAIRRAYLRQVRAHPPERDPEGFRRVREAYELAQRVGAISNWHGARVPPNTGAASASSTEHSAHVEQAMPLEPAREPGEVAEDHGPKPDADPPAEEDESELPPAIAANVAAELSERSLRARLHAALNAEDPPSAALILCKLYAQATFSSELPPPQLAFGVALELFARNRPKRARRLCSAYAGYFARIGPPPLRVEAAAQWKLLTELSALSTQVHPSVTTALASGLRAGELQRAVPELRDEIAMQGEDEVARLMRRHAPSLFSALWPAARPVARRRKPGFGWSAGSSGSLFALFLAIRLLGTMGDCGHERVSIPELSVASPRRASARADDFIDQPRPRPLAATPPAEGLGLDSERERELKELTATIERQYLGGECAALRGSWPNYVRLVRAAKGTSGIAAGYEFRRAQATSICPDLISDLPEQP